MKFKNDRWARAFALAFLLLIEWSAAEALPHAPRNDLYFAICGLFNICTLVMLTSTESRPLMIALAKLTFLQLICQFVGWGLYVVAVPPTFYNLSIKVVVFATFLRILWIGKDDRNYENDTCGGMVPSHTSIRTRKAFGVFG